MRELSSLRVPRRLCRFSWLSAQYGHGLRLALPVGEDETERREDEDDGEGPYRAFARGGADPS